MTDIYKAAQQMLEAVADLTILTPREWQAVHGLKIDALRAALAQPADHIPDARKMMPAEPVPHCEAGPEYCWQCLEEIKPTYGSEEIRKLRDVIANLSSKPARAWVELSDEDKAEIERQAGITEDDDGYIVAQLFRLTEARLKEKNGGGV